LGKRTIAALDAKGKRVLVRVDFNVPIETPPDMPGGRRRRHAHPGSAADDQRAPREGGNGRASARTSGGRRDRIGS